ncbi:MAG TPA: efflux RND transporter periplasmic adaptor subunit [Burkholderiaceae bacterium]|nr:efflux RND transporter periplasmic adaptor subunit [Burkholderiaceae bacterium]
MKTKRFAISWMLASALAPGAAASAEELASVIAEPSTMASSASFDAVVEALRQTVVAAQVSGTVVQIEVRAGDVVRAGQVLLRIDARAADQRVVASDAQVQAARASLDVATQEFDRQQQLYQKNYISQAALERAQAQFQATQAQVSAQLAQAAVARTQSGFFVVKAPYAGIVAEVPVSVGDMAMPGRALLTLYDPSDLRVTAAVPQSAIGALGAGPTPRIEIPGLAADRTWISPTRSQVLPTVDPGTHTVQVRLDLPHKMTKVVPGMFARVWLPLARPSAGARPSEKAALSAPIVVPARAVVRRAEMTGLYVLDANGRPLLRQVRLGQELDDHVEVLAGLAAGERVALEPQSAARVR